MEATETKQKYLRVRIDHDSCTDSPTECDQQWKVYSFNCRHRSYRDPESLGLVDGKIPLVLRRRLEVGLAFFLSYYEHGNCLWSLKGEGPDCPWDSVRCAGLIVWEHGPKAIGGKTYEERKDDAKGFVDLYTDWCNGETYAYAIDGVTPCDTCGSNKKGETLEACGGYIGSKDVMDAIEEAINSLPEEWKDAKIVFEGSESSVATYNLPESLKSRVER